MRREFLPNGLLTDRGNSANGLASYFDQTAIPIFPSKVHHKINTEKQAIERNLPTPLDASTALRDPFADSGAAKCMPHRMKRQGQAVHGQSQTTRDLYVCGRRATTAAWDTDRKLNQTHTSKTSCEP